MAALLVLVVAGGARADDPLTRENGAPVTNNQKSQTGGGYGGPVLLQDFHLVEKLARFDRERIPERVVHARGVGAFGEFESAADLSALTEASLLAARGKKTPVFVRFSTVVHSAGSPETLRDPRGFAVKFYTDQGNWDLVGNNLDVFFIRDAMKFPDMVHSLKPSPVTNQQDPNRFFDFFSNVPESTQMLTKLYSDLGVPANYRQMDGSSVHALKWVNARGEAFYAKLSWKSLNGNVNLDTPEKVSAALVKAQDGSSATSDLYGAIEKGNLPRWELQAQVIPVGKVNGFRFNPLDPTKSWPEKEIPRVVLGTMTLNKVPDNFFEATEEAAFSPGVLVPGIEASEDKLLQGRLFSYADTQRYRVGPNYQALPINAPRVAIRSNNQNGAMSFMARTGEVNYEPSNLTSQPMARIVVAPPSDLNLLNAAFKKEENFYQAGEYYRSLTPDARARLAANLAGDLKQVRNVETQRKIVGFLTQADAEYGARVAAAIGLGRSPDAR
jgi:catalase